MASSESENRHALLVANRTSGAGADALDQAVEMLRQRGLRISPVVPGKPAEIPELIRDQGPETDLIIVGGGDGTLSACIPALLDIGRPLAILPAGTANDLARTLGIPPDLRRAAEVIVEGHARAIDVGTVNGRPFFNVASLGFSAEVARFHKGPRKKWLRLLSYPLSWIDAYRAHRPFRVTVTSDGERRRIRCTMLAIGNGRHYGGGLTIAEDAAIDDSWLHVSYVKPTGLWGLASLFPFLRWGRLRGHELADTWRAQHVRVATSRPRRINVDGELIEETPADFEVRPKVLEVLVPGPNVAMTEGDDP